MKTVATIFWNGKFHDIAIFQTIGGYSVKITCGNKTSSMSFDFIGQKSELEELAFMIAKNFVATAWMIGMDE